MDVSEVLTDLLAEQKWLDEIVSGLDDEQWDLTTPSPGWTVSDQIGHLRYFDGTAALAITDPDEFRQAVEEFMVHLGDSTDADDFTLSSFRALDPTAQLESWREGRRILAAAGSTLTNDSRVVWYGPSMGSKSFLTARLMEVWAHGQDVSDAVGAERSTTDRLRHVAQLGYITRGWSYVNRGLEPPEGDVRVELEAPSGGIWTWGEADDAVVRGPAVDFCLVVTQRRNARDTSLEVVGHRAVDWLDKAQAFAGPATDVPRAGSR